MRFSFITNDQTRKRGRPYEKISPLFQKGLTKIASLFERKVGKTLKKAFPTKNGVYFFNAIAFFAAETIAAGVSPYASSRAGTVPE